MRIDISNNNCAGRVRAVTIANGVCRPTTSFKANTILYSWSEILAELLTKGNSKYRISGMYLEFANVANPGDVVSVPTYNRTRDIDYYTGLSVSSDLDYLRVPLTATTLSSKDALINNVLTFFAMSSGVVGIHGKPFSAANNSVIYGGALVAMPEAGDASQDKIFSAMYLPLDEQQAKGPNNQIGLEWQIEVQ